MQTLTNMTEQDARELLKTLFEEVGVSSTWKWDDALRNISTDKRYRFVRMSMQEKKSVFTQFMSEQKKRESDQIHFKKER